MPRPYRRPANETPEYTRLREAILREPFGSEALFDAVEASHDLIPPDAFNDIITFKRAVLPKGVKCGLVKTRNRKDGQYPRSPYRIPQALQFADAATGPWRDEQDGGEVLG
jgi:hypothetical protein